MNPPHHEELEDARDDILNKSFFHYGINDKNIPQEHAEFDFFLKNTLKLDPETYHNMPSHIPAIPLPLSLKRHELPFRQWTVNVWTIRTSDGLIAVDTGCDPVDFKTALGGVEPVAVLITHEDGDHMGGIDAFPGAQIVMPRSMEPGMEYDIAGLKWKIHNLIGHTDHSIGYETMLDGREVFFPGDSIFARSIGKSRMLIDITMTNILTVLATLSPQTIICPGHGPATTVADEKLYNPFLAAFFK